MRFSRGRCVVSNSVGEIEQRHDAAVQVHEAEQVLRACAAVDRRWAFPTSSLAVANGASRRMCPMRNAWRTISFGFSSTAPAGAASAASSAGAAAVRAEDGKVAFMVRYASQAQAAIAPRIWSGRIGLGDVAFHAEHLGPDAVGFLVLAGDQHDRDGLGGRVAADGARGGEAVHLVHVDVHEDDVGHLRLRHLHGLLAVGRGEGGVAGAAHDLLEIHEIRTRVVDDQYFMNGHSYLPTRNGAPPTFRTVSPIGTRGILAGM